MTSIVPIIVLKGIGKAIAHDFGPGKKRILLLNGCEDRETFGMTASDYIETIVKLAHYSLQSSNVDTTNLKWCQFVTHLFYMTDSKIAVERAFLEETNIHCVEVKRSKDGSDRYDLDDLHRKLLQVSQS